MESLERKFNHFILIVGVVLLCALTSPVTCRAESLTLLTPDLARQMAEEFACDVDGGVSRHACDPIKIYGDNGRAIGYSIDFRKDDGEAPDRYGLAPHGPCRPFQGTQAGLEAQKERPPSLRR